MKIKQQHDKPKLSLILGSGFSAEAGLPVTRDLHKNFLENSKNTFSSFLEEEILKLKLKLKLKGEIEEEIIRNIEETIRRNIEEEEKK